MNEIRVKRGLTYGVSSHFSARRFGGAFEVSTFSRTDKVSETLRVCLDEIERAHESGVSESELQEAKDYFAGGFPLRLETPNAVASLLLSADLYGLGDDYLARYRERIRSVTREETAIAARRHLDPSRLAIVVLGRAAALQGALSRFGPVTVRPFDSES